MKKFLFALILLGWLVPLGVAQQEDAAPAESAATQESASQQPASATPDDSSAQSGDKDAVVEQIVARVNNAIITRGELLRNREQIRDDARQENLAADELQKRERNSLRDLIDQQLLLQKAAELGISADADVIKRLDDIRKQMKIGSMDELRKVAESQGVSWEEFKQNTKNSILTQKVIGSEVGEHIQITQDEIKRYYDAHKDKYAQPERIRLSEILVAADPNAAPDMPAQPTSEQVDAAREKVAKIYDELKDGAHFDELARTESNGPTAAQGGDLGYFKHHDLALQLEAQTFDLKIGQFTAPIRTRQGFLILEVTDRTEAGAPPLERVREQIQDKIYSERIQPALRTYLTKLRNEAYVDIRPGYSDTGASGTQASLIYTTGHGPVTKEVHGKFGFGKKTVLVEDQTSAELAEASQEEQAQASKGSMDTGSMDEALGADDSGKSSSASAHSYADMPVLDAAKARLRDAEDALAEASTPAEKTAAKAKVDAAEKEMLAHMSHREQRDYFKNKKKNAEKEARRRLKEKRRQKELAAKHSKEKSAERNKKAERRPREARKAKGNEPKKEKSADQEQANASQSAPKKKKYTWSWF